MHPVLFRIGGFELRAYGVMLVVGIVVSGALGTREARRVGLPRRQTLDYLLAMGIGGVLGLFTRALPLRWALGGFRGGEQLQVWAHHGGALMAYVLLLAMIAAQVYARLAHANAQALADATAPGWLMAVAIWRVGCWLTGCCYGQETDSYLAINAPGPLGIWAPRYPTQLMELGYCLAVYALLMALRRRKPFDGYISKMGVLLYFGGRLALTFVRGDNYYLAPGLAEMQVYCVALMLYAGWFLAREYWRAQRSERNAILRGGAS